MIFCQFRLTKQNVDFHVNPNHIPRTYYALIDLRLCFPYIRLSLKSGSNSSYTLLCDSITFVFYLFAWFLYSFFLWNEVTLNLSACFTKATKYFIKTNTQVLFSLPPQFNTTTLRVSYTPNLVLGIWGSKDH